MSRRCYSRKGKKEEADPRRVKPGRERIKYRSEVQEERSAWHGSRLSILAYSCFSCKIRQAPQSSPCICEGFLLDFLRFPVWVLHFIFLFVCEEQTPQHGLKAFFLHISAGLLRLFRSCAAIYPSSEYKHVYVELQRSLCLKNPKLIPGGLHRGFALLIGDSLTSSSSAPLSQRISVIN